MNRYVTAIAVMLLRLAAPVSGAEIQQKIADLPAPTVDAGQAIVTELVQAGPDAIRQVVGMLKTPEQGGDEKPRYALSGIALHVARPGAEANRAMVAGVLAEAISHQDRPDSIKAFLISLLQVCGKDESVPALVSILGNRELTEPAAMALSRIGTEKAEDALIGRLKGERAVPRAPLIRALGQMRSRKAIETIRPHLAGNDAAERQMALWALANIGDEPLGTELEKDLLGESAAARAKATSLYLLLAQRLRESGNEPACAKACRHVIATRKLPGEANQVAYALTILTAGPESANAPELMRAVASSSKQLRHAALAITAKFPGSDVAEALVAAMKNADGEQRAELVAAMANRQEPAARRAVVEALKDADKSVRLAAVQGLSGQGDAAVAPLLGVLASGQSDEVKAAQDVLARLPGDKHLAMLSGALDGLRPEGQVAILQILATRRAASQVDAVMAQASSHDASVKAAAIRALGTIGHEKALPRLLDLASSDSASSDDIRRAVVAICKRKTDLGARARPVIDALAKAQGTYRPVFIGILSELGGSTAVEAVAAQAASDDPAIRDAAIRGLADWPDAVAADSLLAIARNNAAEARHRILALRGYVRVVSLPGGRPADQTVKMLKDGMDSASRIEEKRLVLSAAANIRDNASLAFVEPYLDDPTLAGDAAQAAVKIVSPRNNREKPLAGEKAQQVLARVIAVARDENLKSTARKLLQAIGG